MSSYERKTILEDLSPELFFEIFDYFHFIDLYNTFSNLNQRIDDYLSQLPKICLYMCSRQYQLTRKLSERQILRVRKIKFSTSWLEEDQHKIQEFFIQYPMKLFEKLHSLVLGSIVSSTELPTMIDQLPLLPHLTFLYIEFDCFKSNLTANDLRHVHEIIFNRCATLKTLRFTIMDNIDPRKRIYNKPLFMQPITTNVEHLDIYKLYIEDFGYILSPSFLRRVKSLTASIHYDPRQQYIFKEGLALNSIVNLDLTFQLAETLEHLESIFKRTPNLKTLIIASSPVTFITCQTWQYFLSKYLLKVTAFHLHACDWEESEWSKEAEYMDFQTSTYWLTERGGTIQTECQQVWDEEGSEIDSISVTFTTMAMKSWNGKCSNCGRYPSN